MASQQISTNTFGVAKWIVSANATLGTHTTIATAITSASSGDTIWIREGTYTENLTLKAGVNLAAYGNFGAGANATPSVTISGNATMSTAGSVVITSIKLSTNSAAVLTVSGSVASIVNLINCDIEASTTAISYSSSSASSAIILNNCNANINTTGVALYSMSSAGNLYFNNCSVSNPGVTTTLSSNSAGSVTSNYSTFSIPLGTTSTGNINTIYSVIDTHTQNITPITTAGTGLMADFYGHFYGGTASSISVGAGTIARLRGTTPDSTNTNNVTGAGTIIYADLRLSGSAGINVTTLSPDAGWRADAGLITISGDPNIATIAIAGGAAAKTVNIGNTNTTTTVAVSTGTNTSTPVYTVATASGTIMKAVGAGSINYPLTPSFFYALQTADTNATGNGGTYTLGGSHALTKIYDQQSNMTTGGTFTAPVTGNYLFIFTAQITNCTIGTSQAMRIKSTARSYLSAFFHTASSVSFDVTATAIATMTAGDTCTFTIVGSGEAGNTQTIAASASGGDQNTYVCGQLIS